MKEINWSSNLRNDNTYLCQWQWEKFRYLYLSDYTYKYHYILYKYDISNGIIYHSLNKSVISREMILHILIFALITIVIISIKLDEEDTWIII